ncbi:hypothetical protein SAMN05192540_1183 [Maribacter dokdonensis]|uniref:O-Antigen ligase n=3 Tax=Maribacter dokdonensis TaxID=320912 RepID=A0A1H4L3V1_9FLAO|nr:hypothetical protein SAMN05192540_1183 [Maribacter dokdonensis]|tara:strand:- start:1947 stop:3083 length:1137 start_codon:yes stop_codon:yes gene_type:complete
MKLDKNFIGFYIFALVLPLPLPLIVLSIAAGLLILNCFFLIKKPIGIDFLSLLFLLFFLSDLLSLVFSGRSFFENTIINDVKIICSVLPILIFNIKDKLKLKSIQKSILDIFTGGVLVYIVYCILYYFYFIYTHPRYTVQIDNYLFWAIENNFPGTFHRSYIGAYIVFSSVYVLRNFLRLKNVKLKALYGLIFLLELCAIFFLGSKLTMGIFLLVNTLLLLKNYRVLVIPLFLSVLVGFFLIKEWIFKSLTKSYYDRTVFFSRSVEIIDENFLFGIGEKNILKHTVTINDVVTTLIPHNSFLKELLSNGFLGFSILTSLLGYVIYLAFKTNNSLFQYFLVLVISLCLIEDFMYLQRGLFFFIFFTVFFCNTSIRKNLV